MLPASYRLRRAEDFRRTIRSGLRAGSRLLVVHAHRGDVNVAAAPRIGFVVSRAVGSAVVRNGVKRRMRHQVRDRLPSLQPGLTYVIRANPASAGATSDEIGRDLDRCLARVGDGRR